MVLYCCIKGVSLVASFAKRIIVIGEWVKLMD
jgi:hypothetical protein